MVATSLLTVYDILGGAETEANVAFAAAVFDLAKRGCITLKLGDASVGEVIIVRTDYTCDFEAGDATVISKLFGNPYANAGAMVVIQSPLLVARIAQKANNDQSYKNLRRLACAQDALRAIDKYFVTNGFVSRRRPLQVARSLRWKFIIGLVIAWSLIWAWVRQADWGMIAGIVAFVTYVVVWVFVLAPFGRQRHWLTPKGKDYAGALRQRYNIKGERITSDEIKDIALRDLTPRPHWWLGMWSPQTVERMFDTIAESSQQAPAQDAQQANHPQRYEPDKYDRPNWGAPKS